MQIYLKYNKSIIIRYHTNSSTMNTIPLFCVTSQSPISNPSARCFSEQILLNHLEITEAFSTGMLPASFAHLSSAPRSGNRKNLRPFRQPVVSSLKLFRPPVASHMASGKNMLAIIAVFSLSTMATGLPLSASRCSPKRHCQNARAFPVRIFSNEENVSSL